MGFEPQIPSKDGVFDNLLMRVFSALRPPQGRGARFGRTPQRTLVGGLAMSIDEKNYFVHDALDALVDKLTLKKQEIALGG